MTARTGLTNLIGRLRGLAQVGTADYTVGDGSGTAVTYWSDDQLQTVLSLHMTDYFDVMLTPRPEMGAGGTVHYYFYDIPAQDLEEASSGTVYWYVRDSTGATVGTADYAADYAAGQLRFNADRGGTAYYLRCIAYHLNASAAQLWREKAGQAAKYIQFATDGQTFNKQQFFDHCLQMATYYDKQSGWHVSKRVRTDLVTPFGPGLLLDPETGLRHGPVRWPDQDEL